MTSQLEVERDPRLRERIDEQLKRTRETAARIPEFGEVVEETLDALIHLIRRRSTRLHRAALLSLSIFFEFFRSHYGAESLPRESSGKPWSIHRRTIF